MGLCGFVDSLSQTTISMTYVHTYLLSNFGALEGTYIQKQYHYVLRRYFTAPNIARSEYGKHV